MKNSPVDTLINLIIIGENGIILFAIVKIWNQKTNKKRYEWIEKLPILFLSNGMQTINISAPNLLGICFGQQATYFIHRIFPAIFLVFFLLLILCVYYTSHLDSFVVLTLSSVLFLRSFQSSTFCPIRVGKWLPWNIRFYFTVLFLFRVRNGIKGSGNDSDYVNAPHLILNIE